MRVIEIWPINEVVTPIVKHLRSRFPDWQILYIISETAQRSCFANSQILPHHKWL